MYPFDYLRSRSIAEAVGAHVGDARYLAGGQSLIQAMKLRLSSSATLVDLSEVDGLHGIALGQGAVRIGAMTRHSEVARSAEILRAIPALADLARGIGDPMVRNMGTIGGSIANSDPAADYPAAVVGLGAIIHTDRRSIPADQFFLGLFTTALESDEMIVSVEFPLPQRAAYVKFRQPASRFALVGVFVSQAPIGVRVAVTGARPHAFRVTQLEQILDRDFRPRAIDCIELDPCGFNSDYHGSAPYRASMVTVMAKRAVERALEA